ncbi:MAG: RdgB/HAM1 family non-canonical purine NTP pyrophosphatase [Hyphomonadaceae bacterium]|nr:RdgB/HAM1 family non-canonical purine NTP pyrophosphatase [Hyphomonadaceae bacterium]
MTRKLQPGKLIAATHNKGKVVELKDLFEPLGFQVLSGLELDLDEPEETEFTFEGNALIKARTAAQATGAPALSDDSGLEVTALGGMPGVHTAIWAGEPRDFYKAMEKVERELIAIGAKDRSARFVSCLAVAWPDGHEVTFRGEVQGNLTWPPRGEMGFGYDPVFVPFGFDVTFAELEPAQKHAMSHRAVAFEKLKAALL